MTWDLELGTAFWRASKLKNDILRKITGQLSGRFGHFIVKYLSSSIKKGKQNK
jgi:hypothetical protein